ncbi:MAG: hemolysin family protein [Oscillospiraceae bacterium]|nr:hemolysin family protein [Oscillospiraceae bacterium]
MDPDGSMLWQVIALFALVCLNVMFVAGRAAIPALGESKLKKISETEEKKAAAISRMLAHPRRFAAATQFGIVLSGFFAVAIGVSVLAPKLEAALGGLYAGRVISLVVVVGVLAAIILIAGGVFRRVCARSPEKSSLAVVGFLSLFIALSRPFAGLITLSVNGILRLIGIDPKSSDEAVTAEEIRLLLDEGNEHGDIEEDDKDMINNIFDFGDMTAEDLMIHRTDVLALDRSATLAQVVQAAVEENYTRIPVYDGDLDKILGILNVKDLLALIVTGSPEHFDVTAYLRDPFYATESMSAKHLFSALREARLQIAVVVDEHGGTAGILTMEDLVEGIVGSIQDEYDFDEEDEIIQTGEGQYLIDGIAGLEEVCDMLGLALEEDELYEYETIGGYIVQKLGYIPEEGGQPTVTLDNIHFTVLQVEDHRILKLKAEWTVDS